MGKHYRDWPRVTDFCRIAPFNGPVERRGFALISIDRHPLSERMKAYFDPEVTNEEVRQMHPSLMMTGNRIVGPEAREKILKNFNYDHNKVTRYVFKPFDLRWCYLENLRPLFSEPSPDLLRQRITPENAFFLTRDTADKSPEGPPFLYSPNVCDYDCVSGHARHFPALILKTQPKERKKRAAQLDLPGTKEQGPDLQWEANLSERTRNYLSDLGLNDFDTCAATAKIIWLHSLAIGFSRLYILENNDGVRQDWPRIPLPNTKELLLLSAHLGNELACLFDTASGLPSVTAGDIRPELKVIGNICAVEKKHVYPATDLELDVGWGHKDKKGVTMPGEGKVVNRPYTPEELQAIKEGAAALGVAAEDVLGLLGDTTNDVYLNNRAYWKNIPENVWTYTIAGYQVIKKWLSYREAEVLGRHITPDEAREVTNMARRVACICVLEAQLDQNYKSVTASTYAWPTTVAVGQAP